MQDCEHAELSDAGICQTCGVDITSQEFVDSLPEPPESLDYLGDMMGLIHLAQVVAWEIQKSFIIAKALGYRGDYERWLCVCQEYAEHKSLNMVN